MYYLCIFEDQQTFKNEKDLTQHVLHNGKLQFYRLGCYIKNTHTQNTKQIIMLNRMINYTIVFIIH